MNHAKTKKNNNHSYNKPVYLKTRSSLKNVTERFVRAASRSETRERVSAQTSSQVKSSESFGCKTNQAKRRGTNNSTNHSPFEPNRKARKSDIIKNEGEENKNDSVPVTEKRISSVKKDTNCETKGKRLVRPRRLVKSPKKGKELGENIVSPVSEDKPESSKEFKMESDKSVLDRVEEQQLTPKEINSSSGKSSGLKYANDETSRGKGNVSEGRGDHQMIDNRTVERISKDVTLEFMPGGLQKMNKDTKCKEDCNSLQQGTQTTITRKLDTEEMKVNSESLSEDLGQKPIFSEMKSNVNKTPISVIKHNEEIEIGLVKQENNNADPSPARSISVFGTALDGCSGVLKEPIPSTFDLHKTEDLFVLKKIVIVYDQQEDLSDINLPFVSHLHLECINFLYNLKSLKHSVKSSAPGTLFVMLCGVDTALYLSRDNECRHIGCMPALRRFTLKKDNEYHLSTFLKSKAKILRNASIEKAANHKMIFTDLIPLSLLDLNEIQRDIHMRSSGHLAPILLHSSRNDYFLSSAVKEFNRWARQDAISQGFPEWSKLEETRKPRFTYNGRTLTRKVQYHRKGTIKTALSETIKRINCNIECSSRRIDESQVLSTFPYQSTSCATSELSSNISGFPIISSSCKTSALTSTSKNQTLLHTTLTSSSQTSFPTKSGSINKTLNKSSVSETISVHLDSVNNLVSASTSDSGCSVSGVTSVSTAFASQTKAPMPTTLASETKTPLPTTSATRLKMALPTSASQLKTPLPTTSVSKCKASVPTTASKCMTPVPTTLASNRKTPLPTTLASQPKTPLPVTSASQPKIPLPTTSASQPKTPLPTTSASQPKTPLPTTSASQPNTPLPTTSASQPKTPLLTTSAFQPKTPLPTTSASQHKTPLPTTSASHPKTPLPTTSASQPKTPLPTTSASQHKTPLPTTSASQPKTLLPTTSAKHKTPLPTTSAQPKSPLPSTSASQTKTPLPTKSALQPETTPLTTSLKPKTPLSSTSASQPKTPLPTTSASQHKTPLSTISASHPKTPLPTTSASQPKTPLPTTSAQPKSPLPSTSASQPKTPLPTTSDSQTKTPLPNTSALQPETTPLTTSLKPKTPLSSTSASQPKTRLPTTSASQHKTPLSTISASHPKTPLPTTSASQPKTPLPTTSAQPKSPLPSTSASQPKTPLPTTSDSQTKTPLPNTSAPQPKMHVSTSASQPEASLPTISFQPKIPLSATSALQPKTSLATTSALQPKTSLATTSISNLNTPVPITSSSQPKTPLPATSASQPKTPLPTTSASQHKTPLPTTSASQHKTPLPTTSAPQPKTPLPTTSASQPKTPLSTTSASQHKTPLPTTSASQHKTPLPTTSASQPKTPLPTTSASQPKTPLPTTSASQHKTPLATTSASQPKTPLPIISASQPKTPLPTTSASQPKTPLPTASGSQPKTLLPTISASQPKTPLPARSDSQPKTPLPTTSTSQPKTPLPTISASQPKTPLPTTSASQPKTPLYTTSPSQPRTPVPTTLVFQPKTPLSKTSSKTSSLPTTSDQPKMPVKTLGSQTKSPLSTTSASQAKTPLPSTSASHPKTPLPTTSASQPKTPLSTTSSSQPKTPLPTTSLQAKAPVTTTSTSQHKTLPTTSPSQQKIHLPTTSASQTRTPLCTTSVPQPKTPLPTASGSQAKTPLPTTSGSQTNTLFPITSASQAKNPLPTTSGSQPKTPLPVTSVSQSKTPLPTSGSQPNSPVPTRSLQPKTPVPTTPFQRKTPSSTTSGSQTNTTLPSISVSQLKTPLPTTSDSTSKTPVPTTHSQPKTPVPTTSLQPKTSLPTPLASQPKTSLLTLSVSEPKTPVPIVSASQANSLPTTSASHPKTPLSTPSSSQTKMAIPTTTAYETKTLVPTFTSATNTPFITTLVSKTKTPLPTTSVSKTKTPLPTTYPQPKIPVPTTSPQPKTPVPITLASQIETPLPTKTTSQTKTPLPTTLTSQTKTSVPTTLIFQTKSPLPTSSPQTKISVSPILPSQTKTRTSLPTTLTSENKMSVTTTPVFQSKTSMCMTLTSTSKTAVSASSASQTKSPVPSTSKTSVSVVPTTLATTSRTSMPTTLASTSRTSMPTTLASTSRTSVPTTLASLSNTIVPTAIYSTIKTSLLTTLASTSKTLVPTTLASTIKTSVPTTLASTSKVSVPITLAPTSKTTVPTPLVSTSKTSVSTILVSTSKTVEPTTLVSTSKTVEPTTLASTSKTSVLTKLASQTETPMATTLASTNKTAEPPTLASTSKVSTILVSTNKTSVPTIMASTSKTSVSTTLAFSSKTTVPRTSPSTVNSLLSDTFKVPISTQSTPRGNVSVSATLLPVSKMPFTSAYTGKTSGTAITMSPIFTRKVPVTAPSATTSGTPRIGSNKMIATTSSKSKMSSKALLATYSSMTPITASQVFASLDPTDTMPISRQTSPETECDSGERVGLPLKQIGCRYTSMMGRSDSGFEEPFFRKVVILGSTLYRSMLTKLNSDKVLVLADEDLNPASVSKIVAKNITSETKDSLWILATGIYSFIMLEPCPSCRACYPCLSHLSPKHYENTMRMQDDVQTKLKDLQDMKIIVEKELGCHGVVALVPPIPATVVETESFVDHVDLHNVCARNNTYCTSSKSIELLYELFNSFCESHCVDENLINCGISPHVIVQYKDALSGRNLIPIMDFQDYSFVTKAWLVMVKVVIQLALTLRIFTPSQDLQENLQVPSAVMQTLKNDKSKSSSPVPMVIQQEKHILEQDVKYHFDHVVIIGPSRVYSWIKSMKIDVPLHFIDQRIYFSEFNKVTIKEHQKRWPHNTLWVLLVDLPSLLYMPTIVGTQCSSMNCSEPLVFFEMKNCDHVKSKDPSMEFEKEVASIVRNAKNFISESKKDLEEDSALILAPIPPDPVLWASTDPQYTHDEIHSVDTERLKGISILIGQIQLWVDCTNLLFTKWMAMLEEASLTTSHKKILTKYSSTKRSTLDFVNVSSKVMDSESFAQWKMMISSLLDCLINEVEIEVLSKPGNEHEEKNLYKDDVTTIELDNKDGEKAGNYSMNQEEKTTKTSDSVGCTTESPNNTQDLQNMLICHAVKKQKLSHETGESQTLAALGLISPEALTTCEEKRMGLLSGISVSTSSTNKEASETVCKTSETCLKESSVTDDVQHQHDPALKEENQSKSVTELCNRKCTVESKVNVSQATACRNSCDIFSEMINMGQPDKRSPDKDSEGEDSLRKKSALNMGLHSGDARGTYSAAASVSDEKCWISVENINPKYKEKDIKNILEVCGTIKSMKWQSTAFFEIANTLRIKFGEPHAATLAVKILNYYQIFGKRIKAKCSDSHFPADDENNYANEEILWNIQRVASSKNIKIYIPTSRIPSTKGDKSNKQSEKEADGTGTLASESQLNPSKEEAKQAKSSVHCNREPQLVMQSEKIDMQTSVSQLKTGGRNSTSEPDLIGHANSKSQGKESDTDRKEKNIVLDSNLDANAASKPEISAASTSENVQSPEIIALPISQSIRSSHTKSSEGKFDVGDKSKWYSNKKGESKKKEDKSLITVKLNFHSEKEIKSAGSIDFTEVSVIGRCNSTKSTKHIGFYSDKEEISVSDNKMAHDELVSKIQVVAKNKNIELQLEKNGNCKKFEDATETFGKMSGKAGLWNKCEIPGIKETSYKEDIAKDIEKKKKEAVNEQDSICDVSEADKPLNNVCQLFNITSPIQDLNDDFLELRSIIQPKKLPKIKIVLHNSLSNKSLKNLESVSHDGKENVCVATKTESREKDKEIKCMNSGEASNIEMNEEKSCENFQQSQNTQTTRNKCRKLPEKQSKSINKDFDAVKKQVTYDNSDYKAKTDTIHQKRQIREKEEKGQYGNRGSRSGSREHCSVSHRNDGRKKGIKRKSGSLDSSSQNRDRYEYLDSSRYANKKKRKTTNLSHVKCERRIASKRRLVERRSENKCSPPPSSSCQTSVPGSSGSELSTTDFSLSGDKLEKNDSEIAKSLLEAEHNMKNELASEYKMYVEIPDVHPEYQTMQSMFMKEYKSMFGDRLEVEHCDALWRDFWKKFLQKNQESECQEKLEMLRSEHKILYHLRKDFRVNPEEENKVCRINNVESEHKILCDVETTQGAKCKRQHETIDSISPCVRPFIDQDLVKCTLLHSFSLLEEFSSFIGNITPALRLLVDENIRLGIHTQEALKVLTHERNIVLIEIVSQKFLHQSKITEGSLGDKLLEASREVLRILECAGLQQEKKNPFNGVDIDKVAESTRERDAASTIEIIKCSLREVGVSDFSAEDINRIYLAVSYLHFNNMSSQKE